MIWCKKGGGGDLMHRSLDFIRPPPPLAKVNFPSNRALLSITFSTFCRNIKNISQKQTYHELKKSKKYSIIRQDLIDVVFQITAYYQEIFRLFRPIISVILGLFFFILGKRRMMGGGGR